MRLHLVKPAFLELFGYESEKFIEVNIREYTKGGDLIYDDITISPIFNKQREKLIYFLSVHKDSTKTQELLQKLQKLL